jgi:hypothetical protein
MRKRHPMAPARGVPEPRRFSMVRRGSTVESVRGLCKSAARRAFSFTPTCADSNVPRVWGRLWSFRVRGGLRLLVADADAQACAHTLDWSRPLFDEPTDHVPDSEPRAPAGTFCMAIGSGVPSVILVRSTTRRGAASRGRVTCPDYRTIPVGSAAGSQSWPNPQADGSQVARCSRPGAPPITGRTWRRTAGDSVRGRGKRAPTRAAESRRQRGGTGGCCAPPTRR